MNANYKNTLIGSGIGAVIAAALTAAKNKHRKNYIRNIVLGALVGAVGGASVNPAGAAIQNHRDNRLRRREELAEQKRKEENLSNARIRNFHINNDPFNKNSPLGRLNSAIDDRNDARSWRNPLTASEQWEKRYGFLPDYKGLRLMRMSPPFVDYFVDKLIAEELDKSGMKDTIDRRNEWEAHRADGYLSDIQREDEKYGIINNVLTAKDNINRHLLLD